MLAVHKGINISPDEFMAVLDDALTALQKNNNDQREQEAVIYTLHRVHSDIVQI